MLVRSAAGLFSGQIGDEVGDAALWYAELAGTTSISISLLPVSLVMVTLEEPAFMFRIAGPHQLWRPIRRRRRHLRCWLCWLLRRRRPQGSPVPSPAPSFGGAGSVPLEVRYRRLPVTAAAARLMAPKNGARNAQYLPVGAGDVGHVAGGAAAAPYDAGARRTGVFGIGDGVGAYGGSKTAGCRSR